MTSHPCHTHGVCRLVRRIPLQRVLRFGKTPRPLPPHPHHPPAPPAGPSFLPRPPAPTHQPRPHLLFMFFFVLSIFCGYVSVFRFFNFPENVQTKKNKNKFPNEPRIPPSLPCTQRNNFYATNNNTRFGIFGTDTFSKQRANQNKHFQLKK